MKALIGTATHFWKQDTVLIKIAKTCNIRFIIIIFVPSWVIGESSEIKILKIFVFEELFTLLKSCLPVKITLWNICKWTMSWFLKIYQKSTNFWISIKKKKISCLIHSEMNFLKENFIFFKKKVFLEILFNPTIIHRMLFNFVKNKTSFGH